MTIKDKLSFVRKAYKYQKQSQQTGDVLQKVNKTIHRAAPLIEYAADSISARLAKRKTSTLLSSTTSLISELLEESTTIIPSISAKDLKESSNNEVSSLTNWFSQKTMIGIIFLIGILMLIIFFSIQFIRKKRANELDDQQDNEGDMEETNPMKTSIRSTFSSFQE